MGGGGKFRLQTKSIKICENIGKPHFSYLCCQTACFKKLLNQQKIWLNVKDIRKIKDGHRAPISITPSLPVGEITRSHSKIVNINVVSIIVIF